ncbi:MAG: SPOR domain-containing protein [Desulfococcaceae bacterium]
MQIPNKRGIAPNKKFGASVRPGLFRSLVVVYGMLLVLLLAVGWLIGYSIYPPRAEPPVVASAPEPEPTPAPEPEPAPRPAEPQAPEPPPADPLADAMETLQSRLSRARVVPFGIESPEGYRFQMLSEGAVAADAVVADGRTWAIAVGSAGNFDESVDPDIEKLRANGWDPFRFPVLEIPPPVWMAGEAPTAEALAESHRLRSEGIPAIPVRVPELAGIPLRRWAELLSASIPARPYTVRLASFRNAARSLRELNRWIGRRPDVYRVGYDLPERGEFWNVYAGHFAEFAAAEALAEAVPVADAMVRKMPYAVMVGLPESEADAQPTIQRVAGVTGFEPYRLDAPSGPPRLLVGTYRSPESAMKLTQRLRDAGIPAWGVER